MSVYTCTDTGCIANHVVTSATRQSGRQRRILQALGAHGEIPQVDEETLATYGKYLSKKLSFPFTAYYPAPTTDEEAAAFRCTVLELLCPDKHLGDLFDGLFCKTLKGKYEINLPLTDLFLPEDSPNLPWIDDYRYWFGNRLSFGFSPEAAS